MGELNLPVGIGEIKIGASSDDVLVAYGLGSCVAVCLYDPVAKIGGVLHALLPQMPPGHSINGHGDPAKFVDKGIEMLLTRMERQGAVPRRAKIAICGGARMLTAPGFNSIPDIGQRNVLAAEAALSAHGLRVYAKEVGGSIGRTVKLFVADGRILVRRLGKGEVPLEGGWNA